MDFKRLLAGLTVRQFNDIAENWYARLNNLKAFYLDHPENKKVTALIDEMINRMVVVSSIYIRLNPPPVPKKKYREGGISVSSLN